MKVLRVVVVAALLSVPGCGAADTHDAVAEDMVKLMEEFAAAIGGVKDEASAKAAAATIDGLVPRMTKLSERAKALPKLTQAQEDAMQKKVEPRVQAATSKMMAGGFAMAANPELSKIVEPAMERFGDAAKGAESMMKAK
jgi:hypothetical protein